MGSAFIFAIGAMILPMIAFLVINQDWVLSLTFLGIDYKPWRLFIIVCGIPGFLCGLSLFILPESPKFLLAIGEESKAIEVLQKMHRWNGGKEELIVSKRKFLRSIRYIHILRNCFQFLQNSPFTNPPIDYTYSARG